jgi:hypothetical protein
MTHPRRDTDWTSQKNALARVKATQQVLRNHWPEYSKALRDEKARLDSVKERKDEPYGGTDAD